MTIARAAPTCHVVATDLAPGMVEAAKRRAEGVANFRSTLAAASRVHPALHVDGSSSILLQSRLVAADSVAARISHVPGVHCSFDRLLVACRAEVADAEDLSNFDDGTFDVVTCSAGLMLVPDHNKYV